MPPPPGSAHYLVNAHNIPLSDRAGQLTAQVLNGPFVPWSSERTLGRDSPSRSSSPHSGLGLSHIPVCAMRATFFRADRNARIGARNFTVIVKDCPLLKIRLRELKASVWCSSLFSAAWKSQLLILRAVVGKKGSHRYEEGE